MGRRRSSKGVSGVLCVFVREGCEILLLRFEEKIYQYTSFVAFLIYTKIYSRSKIL
jgi:hypothetical protein